MDLVFLTSSRRIVIRKVFTEQQCKRAKSSLYQQQTPTIEIKLLYNGCMWEEEIVFDTRFPNCKLQPLNHYLSEDLASLGSKNLWLKPAQTPSTTNHKPRVKINHPYSRGCWRGVKAPEAVC